jgi:hypothetical protein
VIRREHFLRLRIEPRRLNRIRILKKLRVLRSYDKAVFPNLGYVLTDCEIDNFTYELENEAELALWLSETFSADPSVVHRLLIEARSNQALYLPLRSSTARWSMKTEPPLGRRLGWYVILRLLKPTRVVETGIHDGIGSLVLLSALDRNAEEGTHGVLVSTDIDNSAGWVVGSHPRWRRQILDRPEDLDELLRVPADIFIHDSLHTAAHETFELELAASRMPGCVLISDNSHATNVLESIAQTHGKRYAYWQEQPRAHFYPGAGIGVAL